MIRLGTINDVEKILDIESKRFTTDKWTKINGYTNLMKTNFLKY